MDDGPTYVETAEDLALKELKDREIARMKVSPRYDPDAIYYTLSVTVFQQENDHYCGPATVKQVVHFLNYGSSNSQAYYADQLDTTKAGTIMTNIPAVLNSSFGRDWTYVYGAIGTRASWSDKIVYNASQGIPVILDINTMNVSAFPYRSAGHFVNTSGVDYRRSSTGVNQKIRITDPYGPGLGNRWYNEVDLYNANNNHMRKAFIY